MTESLSTPPTNTSIPQIDNTKNYLEELVGEGKKFKTPEDLARGKYEADLFIESKNRQFDTLAEDYKRLRDEYNAGPKLQELIDQIAKQPATSSNNSTPVTEDTKPTFDPNQLDSLVSEKILKIEADRKAASNFNTVRDKLQAQYGNRYAEVIANQTKELGLTADKVDELAKTSPTAFFRVMGLEDKKQEDSFQAPPRSSLRTDNSAPSTNSRKWSFYKNLQRTKPDLFSDPKTHNQMMADIKSMGESSFYDVD